MLPHLIELLNRWWSDVWVYQCKNRKCEFYLDYQPILYRPRDNFCNACGDSMEEVVADA